MIAIYKKELRASFSGIMGYALITFYLLFSGVFITMNNLYGQNPAIESTYSYILFALLMIIPVLTMRSLAEERQSGTQLLLSSLPLRTLDYVLGKYFALLSVLALPCGVIGVYPILLGMFGSVNFAGAYSAILFFFLLGAALIAVCQFTSALTDNLVVAAVLGVVAMLILLVLPLLDAIMPVEIFSFVAPFVHFEEAATYGLFNIRSLVLLLSYPVFFLFLTTAVVDKKRLS
jgi:ABC-2 type transport system permease protein